jgi:hypothetical protein
MAVLENKTGFAGDLLTAQDARGSLYLVLVVRGTFDIDPGGVLVRAEEQEPLCLEDVYYGEPGQSSIKFASDTSLTKQGTDVVMVGSAYAPNGQEVSRMEVELSVGPVTKRVAVFGDREWSRALGLLPVMSRPKAFLKIPLVYERAFGGRDTSHDDPAKHDWDRRNPVGMGFRTHKPLEGLSVPNIEDPNKLIRDPSDRPAPQGFGFLARDWEPRLSLAGTYDERWQKDQFPLLPEDFDDRFFQAAPPELVCRPHLQGDELVRVVGAVPEGVLETRLPGLAVGVAVHPLHDEDEVRVAQLDTVILRPDESRLNLIWRSAIRCPRKIFDIEEVIAFTVKLETARQYLQDIEDDGSETDDD